MSSSASVFDLSGKVALVTGGSRGIGAATALALADAGADVAISYVSSPERAEQVIKKIEAKGVRAAAFKADQSNVSQAAGLVSCVVGQFGKLDILVNNAGVLGGGILGDANCDQGSIDRLYSVNLTSVVAAIRAAAPVISDGGRIITIGSCLAARTAFPGIADYAATKAAVVGFSKGAARDLGPRGITVNVIQPGSTDTDMNSAEGPGAEGQKALIALGRYAKPEEIAAGVVFLASPAASFITGSTLDIDGGFGA